MKRAAMERGEPPAVATDGAPMLGRRRYAARPGEGRALEQGTDMKADLA
jgi:hypothetical protein